MIFKITIVNPEIATSETRVSTVKEIVDFVNAQFTDVPNMPSIADSMTIECLKSNLPPDCKPNPDYHL